MKPKKRQKMCYNCEGEIDLEVIVCPYCAADLREEKGDSLRAPYAMPTAMKQSSETSLYPPSLPPAEDPAQVSVVQEDESKEKSVAIPTLLFALGVQLFLWGVILCLFSSEGLLVLRWDARLWFLYLFAAIPFLVFGYKALDKLD